MPSKKKVQGFKALNAALETYPNVFFSLHEGVTGTPASQATVTDQNSDNGWELTVENANADQWDAVTGAFTPPNPNAALLRLLTLSRTVDPETFDSVFDVKGKASLFCFQLDFSSLPTNNGKIMTIDSGSNSPVIEMRYLTTGVISFYFGNTSQDIVTFSGGGTTTAQVHIYVDDRADGVKTFSPRIYTTGTKNLVNGTPKDISAATAPDFATDQYFILGGARTYAGGYGSGVEGIGISRCRVINFGQNPPDDLDDLEDELALNSLLATSR